MESAEHRAPDGARRTRRSPEHWGVLAFAGLTLVVLLVLGLFLSPDPSGVGTHEQLGMRACMTMDRWNVPCPGCGVTTSVTLATQGRLLDSFLNQPFGFAVALAMVGFVLWAGVGHLRRRDLYDDLRALPAARWSIAIGVVAALSWVYKIWLVRH